MPEQTPERLSFVEKVGYSLGDGAAQFVFLTMVNFQGPFYTDALGISPAAAGWLSFAARLWDAFFDPFMGFIADRTRTRWGRFRPWLIWTCVPWAILMVLAFTVPPFKEYWATFLYAMVTNIAMWTIYSMNNTPYSALMAVMTGNQKQRTRLSQYRFITAMIGQLIVGGFTLAILSGFGNPVPPQPIAESKAQLAMVQATTRTATQPSSQTSPATTLQLPLATPQTTAATTPTPTTLPFVLSANAAKKPIEKLTFNDMPAMDAYKKVKLAHDIDAWPKTMMVYAAICLVCFVLTFLAVKERIRPTDDKHVPQLTLRKKIGSMWLDARLLKGNGPWLVMFLVTITHYILAQTRGSAYNYYCQYVLDQKSMVNFLSQWGIPKIGENDDPNTMGVWIKFLNASKLLIRYDDASATSSNAYTVVYGLLQMTNKLWNVLGIIAASALIAKFNKKLVVSISLIFNTVFIIGLYFVPRSSIWGVYIVEWLGQIAYAPVVPLLWVLFADVCDYTEWKYGRNVTGFLYATFFFALKAGLSLGSIIGGQVMDAFGYKPNEVQSDTSKLGIVLTLTLVPGFFSIACAISMLFYQITKKQNNEIADELTRRRALLDSQSIP